MLGFQPDFYECAVCMSIPDNLMTMQCPVCSTTACKNCLQDYTDKSKNIPKGNYVCVVCHKDYKMREPNKLMIQFLSKVLKFECATCQRYWSFHEYQTHQQQGRCKKDPNAHNNISNIKSMLSSSATAPSAAVSQPPQPVAPLAPMPVAVQQPSGTLQISLYVCEKDSKNVIEFNFKTGRVQKCTVNMDLTFQHNF